MLPAQQSNLTATLDAVNEAFFYGRPLSIGQPLEVAQQIIERQNPSSRRMTYTGFALDERERQAGVILFTGEKLRTRFPAVDVLSVEACRALRLLAGDDPAAQATIKQVEVGLRRACFVQRCIMGECAHAMAAVWRYLAVGGLDETERRITDYMEILSAQRDGKGRWKRFPFYYTLLALSELDHPAALEEIRYVAPTCERYLRRRPQSDPISTRRRDILERILVKIDRVASPTFWT